MLRAIALAAVAATSPVVVGPALAAEPFVPGRQIGPVAVGDSLEQVRAAAGVPRRDIVRRTPVGEGHTLLFGRELRRCPAGSQWARWGCPRLYVKALNGVVVGISSRSAAYRTADGVGVGSTRAQVQRAIPGIACRLYPRRYVRCAVAAPGRPAATAVLISLGTRRAYSIAVSTG